LERVLRGVAVRELVNYGVYLINSSGESSVIDAHHLHAQEAASMTRVGRCWTRPCWSVGRSHNGGLLLCGAAPRRLCTRRSGCAPWLRSRTALVPPALLARDDHSAAAPGAVNGPAPAGCWLCPGGAAGPRTQGTTVARRRMTMRSATCGPYQLSLTTDAGASAGKALCGICRVNGWEAAGFLSMVDWCGVRLAIGTGWDAGAGGGGCYSCMSCQVPRIEAIQSNVRLPICGELRSAVLPPRCGLERKWRLPYCLKGSLRHPA